MFGNVYIVGYTSKEDGSTFCIECTKKYGGYSGEELDEDTGLPKEGAFYSHEIYSCVHCDNCYEPLLGECDCCTRSNCPDPNSCRRELPDCVPTMKEAIEEGLVLDEFPDELLEEIAADQDERYYPGQLQMEFD
jgi:hypothetical protein